MQKRTTGVRALKVALTVAVMMLLSGGLLAAETEPSDEEIAVNLAELLRAARGVISAKQDLINDPAVGDKGLTGAVVLADTVQRYRQTTGQTLANLNTATRYGSAMSALEKSIVDITDEYQSTINLPGVGFKGLIPAVFARLVSERFDELMRGQAEMKVTAPRELVRNRKALPDAWEEQIIETKLSSPDWPAGQPFKGSLNAQDRQAFRFLIPEYYQSSCLLCHGKPKGELDITGYPKEGREEGSLGGVISITLFH